jgi:hypothetical protein
MPCSRSCPRSRLGKAFETHELARYGRCSEDLQEGAMQSHFSRHLLVAAGVAVTLGACEPSIGQATTTAASPSNDSAVLQVAQARCRRADECHHIGEGLKFADEQQCINAYLDEGAHLHVLRSCDGGIDKGRLDRCLAILAMQHCDENLGPVTEMPYCNAYCAPLP